MTPGQMLNRDPAFPGFFAACVNLCRGRSGETDFALRVGRNLLMKLKPI